MLPVGRRHLLAGLSGAAAAAALGPGLAQALAVQRPLRLRPDDVGQHLAPPLAPGSHVKLFLPNLPYIYTSHSINTGLLRPAPTAEGWEYELATAHRRIDDTTYEFDLRQGMRFQDGTPFDADSVVENVEHFLRAPFVFSKLHETLGGVEKLGRHKVRFHLTERYGQFLNDLLWLHFYTSGYLARHGWNGKATCPNLAEPGPYGLGPFILREGYIEGDRQTAVAELEANPHYWREGEPKVERITIFTELDSDEALRRVQETEGELDVAPIPFHRKIQTLRAPHSKVVATKSTNNFAIHLNLRNGHPVLQERKVRVALNRAIHQANLLSFVYMDEGLAKPTTAAPHFPGVRQALASLRPYSEVADPYDPKVRKELRSILDGLTLKVFTQGTFLWLWKGLAYQLSRVGVTLEITTTDSEKEIFGQLLTTNAEENTQPWDLLIWGMDDWYFNHPWTVFLVYRTSSVWSTIFPDPTLDSRIDALFREEVGTSAFNRTVAAIMRRVYEEGYMLFVPAPNQVMGVNKEVSYMPYPMAAAPLWEVQVSRHHWSLREGPLPEGRKAPIQIQRRRAAFMEREV